MTLFNNLMIKVILIRFNVTKINIFGYQKSFNRNKIKNHINKNDFFLSKQLKAYTITSNLIKKHHKKSIIHENH